MIEGKEARLGLNSEYGRFDIRPLMHQITEGDPIPIRGFYRTYNDSGSTHKIVPESVFSRIPTELFFQSKTPCMFCFRKVLRLAVVNCRA